MKRALVCGVSGQDGAYLAASLLARGYEVFGTSRDAQVSPLANLERLGIRARVAMLSMAPTDFRSVLNAFERAAPQEVYFLAGQSSVGLSFEQPAETLESITLGTLNLLEAVRYVDPAIRFYHAGSSEAFGDTGGRPANEDTPFRPRSPYAVAKASAHWMVANYRESYGLHASSGILFNHESPLRPARFVTRKIIATVRRIAAGERLRLALGRLDVVRDWGWAPEYVEAMWGMLQLDAPRDLVIATGESHRLDEFVAEAFAQVGLDWHDHVDRSEALLRPSDLAWSQGDPARAEQAIGWKARKRMREVVAAMLASEPTASPAG